MRLLRLWLPVILWAAIILAAANDRFSDEETGGWLDDVFGNLTPVMNVLMRKGGHVAEYAILALLAWRARQTLATPLVIAAAVAIADESLQAMTVTRTGSPWDVAVDLCGALLALALWPASRARMVARFGVHGRTRPPT